MFNENCPMFFRVLTPLHAGGGTELSVLDLPIQRESHTGFPKIEASTLKGCLRDAIESQPRGDTDVWKLLFGAEGNEELFSAAAAFIDARLLFFPVRSAKGVFALITCPMVLQRFCEDMSRIGCTLPLPFSGEGASVPCGTKIAFQSDGRGEKAVLLDEFLYPVKEESEKGLLGEFLDFLEKLLPPGQFERMKNRTILLPDDEFKEFVTTATSVVTRIAIDESGTVKDGALFTEEYLPEESVLYSLVMMGDARAKPEDTEKHTAKELMERLKGAFPATFQIGADLTLGKGFVAATLPWNANGGVRNA